jgi:hypothetical protein
MRTKFTKEENIVLSEIYRTINYFHEGTMDEKLMLLEYPSKVKSIIQLGIIVPYSTQRPKELNWYSLTDKGKNFFRKYLTKKKLSEDMNLKLFEGTYVKQFNFKLLK